MFSYEKLRPALFKWAKYYCNNQFDFWELINEAWLSTNVKSVKNVKVISQAVRRGMLTYIRERDQYRTQKRAQQKGKRFPRRIYCSARMDEDGEEFKKLENLASFVDSSYEAIDYNDFIDRLLQGFSRREKFIVKSIYIGGLTMREVGEVIGVTQSRVSLLHKNIIERLRAKWEGQKDSLLMTK